MSKAAVAIFLALAGLSMPPSLQAAPLTALDGAASVGVSMLVTVRGKAGPAIHRPGHLGNFRPGQVPRVRPLVNVRPLVHPKHVRPLHHRKHAHRKRPRPHTPNGVPPEAKTVSAEYRRYYERSLSPDFCRYWSDRGEIGSFGEPCW